MNRFSCSRLLAVLTGLLALGGSAHAQGAQAAVSADAELAPANTALVRTQVPDPALADFGRAIERVVRAQATELGVVSLSGTPALELHDIQLMVGCLSDTPDCFDAFAEQLEVEALLMPTLEQAGEEYLVTITYYDRRTREIKSEARRGADENVEASLIAAIDVTLRELFGLPPAPEGSYDYQLPGGGAPPDTGLGIGPGLAIGLVGVAALGAAVGVGVAAQNANDDFVGRPTPTTAAEVDALFEVRDEAQRKATAATALYIAGGVVLGAGVILLAVAAAGGSDDDDDDEETTDPADAPAEPEGEVAFAPMIGRGTLGIAIGGTL